MAAVARFVRRDRTDKILTASGALPAAPLMLLKHLRLDLILSFPFHMLYESLRAGRWSLSVLWSHLGSCSEQEEPGI